MPPRDGPGTFPTRRGGFCTPRTGGAFTGATDAVPVPSTGTVKEVRPLTFSPSSRGQSSGGALWTPAYIPSRRSDQSDVVQQHWTVHVQCLYISCYVTVPDPGKGVGADPVNGGAIFFFLGKGGSDPQGGNKERQLSPDKGRDKT